MEAQIDGSGRELQPHGTADFPCAAYETEDTGFPWHWHEEFEAISVLSGELEVAAGDRRLRLSSGQAVLLSPGAPHALFPCPAGAIRNATSSFIRICSTVRQTERFGGTSASTWPKPRRGSRCPIRSPPRRSSPPAPCARKSRPCTSSACARR